MDELIQQAADILKKAEFVAVLTGAGVSKESGVPTFRDAMDGLWAKYDPQQLATPAAFQQNPKLVWDWYEYRRSLVRNATPNPGHVALAQLAQRVPQFSLITQNVDDLHEQAGNTDVIHLHGNIAQTKCFFNCQGNPTLVDISQMTIDPLNTPPACPHCGRWLRPNVVWFTEALPMRELSEAMDAVEVCDVCLVIGTSGLVEPAASLPKMAKQHHAKLIEVNPDHSTLSRIADVKLQAPSGEVLPLVLAAMGK
jgi:NAD-dependent deacetylase